MLLDIEYISSTNSCRCDDMGTITLDKTEKMNKRRKKIVYQNSGVVQTNRSSNLIKGTPCSCATPNIAVWNISNLSFQYELMGRHVQNYSLKYVTIRTAQHNEI